MGAHAPGNTCVAMLQKKVFFLRKGILGLVSPSAADGDPFNVWNAQEAQLIQMNQYHKNISIHKMKYYPTGVVYFLDYFCQDWKHNPEFYCGRSELQIKS